MSKILTLQKEVDEIVDRFQSNRWLMTEALLQIIHRENIITGNRLRRRHGETEIIPEPVMYQTTNRKKLEWVIDVPKSWYSLTGKDKS